MVSPTGDLASAFWVSVVVLADTIVVGLAIAVVCGSRENETQNDTQLTEHHCGRVMLALACVGGRTRFEDGVAAGSQGVFDQACIGGRARFADGVAEAAEVCLIRLVIGGRARFEDGGAEAAKVCLIRLVLAGRRRLEIKWQ
jgi:hypothetical protein